MRQLFPIGESSWVYLTKLLVPEVREDFVAQDLNNYFLKFIGMSGRHAYHHTSGEKRSSAARATAVWGQTILFFFRK